MNNCLTFLKASRIVARDENRPTDAKWSVIAHGDDCYEVLDGMKSIWYGNAHCKYCARSEALAEGA